MMSNGSRLYYRLRRRLNSAVFQPRGTAFYHYHYPPVSGLNKCCDRHHPRDRTESIIHSQPRQRRHVRALSIQIKPKTPTLYHADERPVLRGVQKVGTTTSNKHPRRNPSGTSTDDQALKECGFISSPTLQNKSLASYEVIRYGSDETLVTAASKMELHQMNTAKAFFEHVPRFLYSAESLSHHNYNSHTPEVVILGASNVGKSTFLNTLVNKSSIARVSPCPGKTTLVNAYGVGPRPKVLQTPHRKGTVPPNHSLILVDTPGYGFKSQASWGDSVLDYIERRKTLCGAVLLLSTEKKLLAEDIWMLGKLAQFNMRTIIVLTKADKCRNDWPTKCTALAASIQTELWTKQSMFRNTAQKRGNWMPEMYITAVGKKQSKRIGNGGGMGAVKKGILEMAGFSLRDGLSKQDGAATYVGQVVPFHEVPWKI